jgi:hypothetical protein
MKGTDTEEIYRHADIHNIYVCFLQSFYKDFAIKCFELGG